MWADIKPAMGGERAPSRGDKRLSHWRDTCHGMDRRPVIALGTSMTGLALSGCLGDRSQPGDNGDGADDETRDPLTTDAECAVEENDQGTVDGDHAALLDGRGDGDYPFHFGLSGYDVDTAISVEYEEHDQRAFSLEVTGDRITSTEDVRFAFRFVNGCHPVKLASRPPAPFGPMTFEPTADDPQPEIHPWTDAFGSHELVGVNEAGGLAGVGDVAAWEDIAPTETDRREYRLDVNTPYLTPGLYEYAQTLTGNLILDDRDIDLAIDLTITMRIEARSLPPGDVVRAISLAEAPASDYPGALSVEVVDHMTDSHPGRLEISFCNDGYRDIHFFHPGPPPFAAYVGRSESGDELVLIPHELYAPGLVDAREGIWVPDFVPAPQDGRRGSVLAPDEEYTKQYAIVAHPENDRTLPPGEYTFESWYQTGEPDAEEVDERFVLSIEAG